MSKITDFHKERAKRTGQPMYIGCPNCGKNKWWAVVINTDHNVVLSRLECASKKCDGKSVAYITNGVIDE